MELWHYITLINIQKNRAYIEMFNYENFTKMLKQVRSNWLQFFIPDFKEQKSIVQPKVWMVYEILWSFATSVHILSLKSSVLNLWKMF